MNVSLPPDLETFVRKLVDSGVYPSASEVVREGLRRLQQEPDELAGWPVEELRREVAVGVEQADRGEVAPFDEAALARVKVRHIHGD